LIEARQLIV